MIYITLIYAIGPPVSLVKVIERKREKGGREIKGRE